MYRISQYYTNVRQSFQYKRSVLHYVNALNLVGLCRSEVAEHPPESVALPSDIFLQFPNRVESHHVGELPKQVIDIMELPERYGEHLPLFHENQL